jgi:hypothetical protein
VTANTREFSRVLDLQLENWRVAPPEVREPAAEYRVVKAVRPRQSIAA